MTDTTPVVAVGTWRTNADLIADVARLGYLDGTVLDVTYGLGRFWTTWRPQHLTGTDLDPTKSLTGTSTDFTNLPFADDSYDTVVIDPPYRLNGTPDRAYDPGYGISQPTRWQDRMDLILQGVTEACRVARHHVLVKCQAQVVSGRVRWQDLHVIHRAHQHGWRLHDRFDLVTAQRPQPAGRRQVHARRNNSTLLVFRKA